MLLVIICLDVGIMIFVTVWILLLVSLCIVTYDLLVAVVLVFWFVFDVCWFELVCGSYACLDCLLFT